MKNSATAHRAGTVSWLLNQTRDLLPPLALACLFACLTKLATLCIYLCAGLGLLAVLDIPMPAGMGFPGPGWLVAILIGSGLLKGGLRYAEQFVGHRVAFLALTRLRNTMYAAYERQAPFGAATKNSGGLLSKATADIDRVEVFFAHTLPPAVAALVVSATVSIWVGTYFGFLPALILIIGYLCVGVLVPMIGVPRLAQAARTQAGVRGRQNQLLAEALAGIEPVHGFAAGKQLITKLNQNGEQTQVIADQAAWRVGMRSALSVVVVWSCALGLAAQSLGNGEIGASMILLSLVIPSFEAVRAVDGFVLGLQDSLTSARRLQETAQRNHPVPDSLDPSAMPHSAELVVRGLRISHGENLAVKDVGFTVAPGEFFALVGASGSGKSSIADALVQAIPSEGDMSYGSVPLRDVEQAFLRSRLILVSQQSQLVRGTIRENLLLGSAQATDEQLVGVLTELGLGSWLVGQRNGLDTRLGDRFSRVSGGQRQRLAIARALIRHPGVLILDESTSALDAKSEQLVLEAFKTRRRYGMSVLMISHRISILSEATRVLVLKSGLAAESGTPRELFADPTSLFYRSALREADQLGPKN